IELFSFSSLLMIPMSVGYRFIFQQRLYQPRRKINPANCVSSARAFAWQTEWRSFFPRVGSTRLGTGMNVPFNSASRELYAQAKAVHFWQAINHPSNGSSPRYRGNNQPFTGPPGPIA